LVEKTNTEEINNLSIQKWKKTKKNWINSSTSSHVVFAKRLKPNNTLMFKDL